MQPVSALTVVCLAAPKFQVQVGITTPIDRICRLHGFKCTCARSESYFAAKTLPSYTCHGDMIDQLALLQCFLGMHELCTFRILVKHCSQSSRQAHRCNDKAMMVL